MLAGLKPGFLKPVIGLERGLTDPITDLNMGQTAEKVGHLFGVTRREADEYAAESHRRLAAAQADGTLAGEVVPAFSRDGRVFDRDDGVRPDSTARSLGGLKPCSSGPTATSPPAIPRRSPTARAGRFSPRRRLSLGTD